MDAIQLFVPTFRIEECLAEIRECLEKGWTGIGFKTVTFEDAWKSYTGLPHAHFLNSATSGLHLALRLLKERHEWSDGDEVVTTPLTFVSTNHAIIYENLKPVFADVDEYLCLDPDSVRERITDRTRAIMFVGLGGNTGRLQAITQLAQEFDLRLILDASHMAGTRFHGRHVGHESDVAIFSFQAVKNLPTADSGMICFADPDLDADARKWTWLGINKDTFTRTASLGAYKWHYDVEHPGFKYHGNSLMAGVGLVSLKYLDQDNSFRRQIASWYEANLSNTPGIEIIPVASGCESSRHLFQVMVDYRDEVMASLNTMNIFPGVHYRDNTLYRMFSNTQPCPNARQASTRLVSMPMHLRLSYNDVLRVSHSFIEVIDQMSRYHRGNQVA
jgi:dTDP-4-amino-4,6-dideoxygalactose transaminase